jgi:hypothetical protein
VGELHGNVPLENERFAIGDEIALLTLEVPRFETEESRRAEQIPVRDGSGPAEPLSVRVSHRASESKGSPFGHFDGDVANRASARVVVRNQVDPLENPQPVQLALRFEQRPIVERLPGSSFACLSTTLDRV